MEALSIEDAREQIEEWKEEGEVYDSLAPPGSNDEPASFAMYSMGDGPTDVNEAIKKGFQRRTIWTDSEASNSKRLI